MTPLHAPVPHGPATYPAAAAEVRRKSVPGPMAALSDTTLTCRAGAGEGGVLHEVAMQRYKGRANTIACK